MITATVNGPYPNRIQLEMDLPTGPFESLVLGFFDPRRDLELWVDGKQLVINNFSFDAINNRYLIYTANPFNLQGIVQLIHHVPNPPFLGVTNPLLFNITPGDDPDVDVEV